MNGFSLSYDAFVGKLASKMGSLRAGSGFEAGVTQGPLIDAAGLAKAQQHIKDATSKGARVVQGGSSPGGLFLTPTLLADVTADMLCAREETFGPVAPIFRFRDEQEIIALANNTEFGLASYIYSRDVGKIMRVAEQLEYGMVSWEKEKTRRDVKSKQTKKNKGWR